MLSMIVSIIQSQEGIKKHLTFDFEGQNNEKV